MRVAVLHVDDQERRLRPGQVPLRQRLVPAPVQGMLLGCALVGYPLAFHLTLLRQSRETGCVMRDRVRCGRRSSVVTPPHASRIPVAILPPFLVECNRPGTGCATWSGGATGAAGRAAA